MKKILLFILMILLVSCSRQQKIPDGLYHVKDNIYEDNNGNQFVWVEVKELYRYDFKNGNKVGLSEPVERIYYGEERKESVIYDTEFDFNSFKDSVAKHSGFYISRYLIGKDNNELVSKKDVEPLVFVSRDEALSLAQSVDISDDLISTLPLSYAYDALFLSDMNNYEDAGRLSEWSSEYSSNSYYHYKEDCVSRGSNYGDDNVDISRRNYNSSDAANEFTGFRILLYWR